MKKTSFNIASLLLAFIVLFSTVSFSVDKHYCGDMLFSKTVFSHADDCHMQPHSDCDEENFSQNKSLDNGCCQNIQEFIKGQNLEQKALQIASLDIQKIAIVVDFNSFDFDAIYKPVAYTYQDYSPPLLVKNIPVLVQTFRI